MARLILIEPELYQCNTSLFFDDDLMDLFFNAKNYKIRHHLWRA